MDSFEKWILEMVKQKPELVTGWPCLVCGQDPEVILTEVLSKYRALKAKAKVLTHKMGGMVCPECSTIVCLPSEYQKKDKAEEPLAVLADIKNVWYEVIPPTYFQRINSLPREWAIVVWAHGHNERFVGPTYAAAEKAARAWLMKQEDK